MRKSDCLAANTTIFEEAGKLWPFIFEKGHFQFYRRKVNR